MIDLTFLQVTHTLIFFIRLILTRTLKLHFLLRLVIIAMFKRGVIKCSLNRSEGKSRETFMASEHYVSMTSIAANDHCRLK